MIKTEVVESEIDILRHEITSSFKLIVPAFIAAFMGVFLISNYLIVLILNVSRIENVMMVTTRPFEMISMMLSTSFWVAMLLISPFLLWKMGKIIKPALYPEERRMISKALIVGVGLFLSGVAFAYFVFVPLALQMIGSLSVQGVINMWSIHYIFSFILGSITAFGLMFQLPVLLVILQISGVVTAKSLRTARPVILIIIMIVSAWITPQDIFTMFIMALPLFGLYEAGIIAGAHMTKKKGVR